jgi:hypothetical protein
MLHDALGRAPNKGMLETGASVRREHDQIRGKALGEAADFVING